jgi:hypothetical protein
MSLFELACKHMLMSTYFFQMWMGARYSPTAVEMMQQPRVRWEMASTVARALVPLGIRARQHQLPMPTLLAAAQVL